MRDDFVKSLYYVTAVDPRVLLITGDLGFGVFDKYRKDRSEQFINAGVSEQNMTLLATGLAMEGFVPFTYSIGNFPTLRCLEMIRNDAAYHGAGVKVVCIGGGFSYGALGISHHATEDLAIMRALPDVSVVCPSGAYETVQATKALIDIPGTCYLRLDKSVGDDSEQNREPFEFGKIRKIKDGKDVSIIVAGGILGEVQKAANELAVQQIDVAIYSSHTLKPFDQEKLLKIARSSTVLLTVEEHTVSGGLGGLVAETLIDHQVFPRQCRRLGLREGFSSKVGSQEYLRSQYGLDAKAIVGEITQALDSL